MIKTVTLFLLFCLCNSAAATSVAKPTEQSSVIALFKVINQRLGYMEDVALYKAQNQLPIENLKREQQVLASAVKAAAKQGLNPEPLKRFFAAQIIAAKIMQYRYRAEFLAEPMEREAPDLNRHIRPALMKLGNRITALLAAHIKQYGAIKPALHYQFNKAIKVRHLSDVNLKALFESLTAIEAL